MEPQTFIIPEIFTGYFPPYFLAVFFIYQTVNSFVEATRVDDHAVHFLMGKPEVDQFPQTWEWGGRFPGEMWLISVPG